MIAPLHERAENMAKQFALEAPLFTIEPFGRGHINDTFLVTMKTGERAVLQKVNPIFAPSVLEDIDAITRKMKERGLVTPELIRTKSGTLGVTDGEECWRMLTYVTGRTIEEGVTRTEAESAMALIGNFHQAFAKDNYVFQHVRKGFHDTPHIMETLTHTVREYKKTEKDALLASLAGEILHAYKEHPHAWTHLPKRIIHGDPKLNNVRFAEHGEEALALIDLDTFGRHSVVIDIGDAARSWCNLADEGDEAHVNFNLDIFRAMMKGYVKHATFLTQEECSAIPHATAQIALELAARFATDAYRESYFKLDRERYHDLLTQNSAKARAQFALYRDIRKKIPQLNAVVQKH